MRKLTTAIQALRAIRSASRRYGIGYTTALRRFLRLYARRFSPKEIEFNDLLNPRVSDEALEHCASRDESLRLDAKHVLPAYLCVTNDKAVFYALCASAAIPIPRLLAIFDRPAGSTPAGESVRGAPAWCEFFRRLPPRFIVKPAMGLQGRGAFAFARESELFVESGGGSYTHEQLYAFLCAQKSGNLFASSYSHHSLRLARESHKIVLQEQLFAHGEVAKLTGSPALCTARVLTSVNDADEVEILGCAFRLINGRNIVDNLDAGTRGNLWCSVDTRSGEIVDAFARSPHASRLEPVTDHPTTGNRVVGFRIPDWNKALTLALRLASVVRPQPLVTWDIGIARDGPVAIEGNIGGMFLPSPLDRRINELLAG